MKKLLALVLSLMLLFSFASCGENEKYDDTKKDETKVETQYNNSYQTTDKAEDKTTDKNDASEWKKFIKEYDEWVDDYIAIVKKYKDNPTDFSILADYTEMMSDLAEWSAKADKVSDELEDSPAAAMEYAAELAKIAAKLAKAAY